MDLGQEDPGGKVLLATYVKCMAIILPSCWYLPSLPQWGFVCSLSHCNPLMFLTYSWPNGPCSHFTCTFWFEIGLTRKPHKQNLMLSVYLYSVSGELGRSWWNGEHVAYCSCSMCVCLSERHWKSHLCCALCLQVHSSDFGLYFLHLGVNHQVLLIIVVSGPTTWY